MELDFRGHQLTCVLALSDLDVLTVSSMLRVRCSFFSNCFNDNNIIPTTVELEQIPSSVCKQHTILNV